MTSSRSRCSDRTGVTDMVDDLLFKSIRELASIMREGQVSPVGVTEYFLARLDELGPGYNSLVTLTEERALETARRVEAEIASGEVRGLLSGIPWGAKDLLATTGGIPTTWGAEPLRDQTFDHDATVVARLESAGAPLAAKVAMIELAGGMGYHQPNASLTGPPRNPWDRDRWDGRLVQRFRRGGCRRTSAVCNWGQKHGGRFFRRPITVGCPAFVPPMDA